MPAASRQSLRVVLIDWNAEAAEPGMETLRRARYDARLVVAKDSGELRKVVDQPLDAILIDLSRRPSEGRNIGVSLRQRRATRALPLVFVGGDAEKVARIRKLLPDATFTDWRRIGSGLREALRQRPSAPIVVGVMDAYSGTPLPQKLGIRADMRVALLGAPAGFVATLPPLPDGVRFQAHTRGAPRMILLFAKSQADLRRRFEAAGRALATGGSLWILWRKQASGQATDLGEKEVRAFGLAHKFVDYKISSIDSVWSGLRFARRKTAPAHRS